MLTGIGDGLVNEAEAQVAADQDTIISAEASLTAAIAAATYAHETHTRLTAPVDGSIINLTLRPGDTAEANRPLVGIVDAHAWRIVANFNRVKQPNIELKPARDPLHEASEIYGIIPNDVRKPYDVRDVIARIVDCSELDEFKALYGTTLVCGFAHIFGYPVGILANNGILFSESALKGAHFI